MRRASIALTAGRDGMTPVRRQSFQVLVAEHPEGCSMFGLLLGVTARAHHASRGFMPTDILYRAFSQFLTQAAVQVLAALSLNGWEVLVNTKEDRPDIKVPAKR